MGRRRRGRSGPDRAVGRGPGRAEKPSTADPQLLVGDGRARCHPSRSRPTGKVAAAIPPITRPDAEQLGRRRSLAEQHDGQAHRHHRLDQQDDRGDDRGQPWQRDRDQQVAGRLRGDPERRQPEQAVQRRGQVQLPGPLPDDEGADRHQDRGDGDRSRRTARIAAAAPDDQQIGRVADRGRDAEDDAELRRRPVRAGPDDAGDQDDPGQHDRQRQQRGPRRPLTQQQPREEPDDDHLEVAEDGGQARPDGLDGVVPEHQVAGEEDPRDRGEPDRLPRQRSVPPALAERDEDEQGQAEDRAVERPGRGRDRGVQVEDTGERDARRPDQGGKPRPFGEPGERPELAAQV